eukprot:scaffold36718_cov31-Phaeocystis_antarctica.AAC.2
MSSPLVRSPAMESSGRGRRHGSRGTVTGRMLRREARKPAGGGTPVQGEAQTSDPGFEPCVTYGRAGGATAAAGLVGIRVGVGVGVGVGAGVGVRVEVGVSGLRLLAGGDALVDLGDVDRLARVEIAHLVRVRAR